MSGDATGDRAGGATPRVMLVGGADVDSRLDLMVELRDEFTVSAAGANPDLGEWFERRGFDYHYFPLRRGASPVFDVRSLWTLWRLFGNVRPHVVHAFSTKPSVWGRIAARKAGVPVVVGTIPGLGSLYTSYTSNALSSRIVRPMYESVQRWACRLSDATVFQNHADLRQFVEDGICDDEDALVIPSSGVPMDRFCPSNLSPEEVADVRRELGAETDSVVVTMVSRLIRSKGVMAFSRAAPIVSGSAPRVRFVLVGPEDPRSFEALSSVELDEMRQNVLWLGERSDVPQILAASDIFVLPSFHREGIPRVLLEAAAMGLPLISSPNPGSREVVTDGVNGVLVQPRDPEALARAVVRLSGNAELRAEMGRRARKTVEERFDVRVVASKTRDLYRTLLSGERMHGSPRSGSGRAYAGGDR